MQDRYSILLVSIIAALIRFWQLGDIPQGLSLQEVKFALYLSNVFGEVVYNPFLLRLPFALLGTVSIVLWFVFLIKYNFSRQVTILATLLLIFTPWHIHQSRVLSIGMVIMVLSLILLLILRKLILRYYKKIYFVLSCMFILVSLYSIILQNPINVKHEVGELRGYASRLNINSFSYLFSNKYLESLRLWESLTFEYLDLGNYFFSGYPRERWGVEEIQKFYLVLLPFIFISFIKRSSVNVSTVILSLFMISLLVLFKIRDSDVSIVLLLPLLLIIVKGLMVMAQKIQVLVMVLMFIEFSLFSFNYYTGLTEGLFSPRRPLYEKIAKEIYSLNKNIIVADRLQNARYYFQYYLKNDLEKLKFREVKLEMENDKERYFLDVLSNGLSLERVEIIKEYDDSQNRKQIVLYRIR